MKRLLVLSTWPEWMYAMKFLGKRVENRGRRPPKASIGQWVALHGARLIGGKEGTRADAEAAIEIMMMVARVNGYNGPADPTKDPPPTIRGILDTCAGGVGAIGRLVEVVEPGPVRHGWHMPEAFGLRFDPLLSLDGAPIPCRGMPGFFALPPELAAPIAGGLPKDAPQDLHELLREIAGGAGISY